MTVRRATLCSIVLLLLGEMGTGQIAPPKPPQQPPIPTTGRPITGMGSGIPQGTTGYVPPQTGYSPPKTYSDYYSRTLKEYHRPPETAREYTINKHFYHRPTISPYLNLTRRTPTYGRGNYQQFVVPEVERRAAAQPARKAPPKSFSPYYSQFYGSHK